MTTRLDLPDNGWAVITPPRKVKERKRRRWLTAATAVTGSDGMSEAAMELVLCLVEQWSFGDVTAAVYEDLAVETTDMLVAACVPLAEQLAPNFEADPDPKAPTAASTP